MKLTVWFSHGGSRLGVIPVNDYVEPFLLIWGDKVAGDQIELGVGCCEVVFTAFISPVQPGAAGFVVDIDEVKAVRGLGGICQTAQPLAVCGRVGGEIENHIDPGF